MGYNDSYYRRELNGLLNTCIRELRRHDCENEPTNDYKFNRYLLNSVNLSPFQQLDEMIADMIYEGETITVADINAAANIFLFMSFLSSEGIINNFIEDDDEFDEDGIRIAKKERVCYPFISLLLANKCDFHMLGHRLFPRIIIGGLEDIKNLLIKLQNKYPNWINFPYDMSLDKFCDSIYLSFVPDPTSFDAMVTPYFRNRADKFMSIKVKYSDDELNSMYGKRDEYLKWFNNMISALHATIKVDQSINLSIW